VTSNHLLQQGVLPKVDRRLGPHVGNVLREQGMHQTDKFAGRENEGAFVLMFGHLLVLAPVVGFVLQVEHSERIGTEDEVVATIDVADLGQAGILGDEAPGGAPVPGQANLLSQVPVFREARDVDDLGQEAGGDDRAEAPDGDDGVGDGVDGLGDPLVEPFHEAVDEVDVIPDGSKREGEHLVQLGFDGVGRAQSLPDGASSGIRITKVSSAATVDEVGELMERQVAQFGGGEASKEIDSLNLRKA